MIYFLITRRFFKRGIVNKNLLTRVKVKDSPLKIKYVNIRYYLQ